MFKKLKDLFFSTLLILGLTSCIQIQPNTKYSFNDITNKEISDVSRVLINNGPMTSAQILFEGDYEKILDVDYVLSDMPYNDVKKIKEDYRFWLYLKFHSINNTDTDIGISFYVYDYKLYYFSNELLYESLNKVNYNDFVTSVPPIDEVHTSNVLVMYDYGMHISGKLTTLLGGNLIWFNPKDYGIDKLVAGDELVIKYTGEYEVLETYPGRVVADKMNIQSIEVIEADIVEFTVSAVPGGNELNLVPVDSKYNNYVLSNQGYVVSQDETFKKYDQYPENTILYASLPKTTGSIRVDGLYDYNPREKSIVPTGQYELSIIDKGNDIIDELSHDAGMYTPGTMLEFYSHPIMDADLAMYVNDWFYKTQDTIRVNDKYMWKYTFIMPAEDVVIEFKTFNIEYVDVRNALNIPNVSFSDVTKVRFERGHIGVAPGSLTDIMYSSDMEDINMILSLLEMPVYEDKTNSWQVDGGGYTLYSIFTNNDQYDIRITNGHIYSNQRYYKFIGEYISFEYPSSQAHSYITYLDNFDAYTMDNDKVGSFNGLSEYEFIAYPYDTLPENENLGYLETEIGRLYILSDEIFYIKDGNTHTYFLVTGKKIFKDIFIN